MCVLPIWSHGARQRTSPSSWKLLKLTGIFLTLATASTPSTILSQPEFDLASTEAQQRMVEEIQGVLSRAGPNSSELIEPFTALGFSYQESGDFVISSAAIQRAREIVRVNYGPNSLEQASLIQQLILNEKEMGNIDVAWDLEQELLTLTRRHPSDLRAVPILRGIADDRMHVLSRYFTGDISPQIILGCYYDLSLSDNVGSCQAGTRSTVSQRIVGEAQRHYADAIGVLLRNELYSSEELRALEIELVRSSDLIRYRNDSGDRTLGLDSLHGLEHTEPWRSQMDTVVRLARWDLDFRHDSAVTGRDDAIDRELAVRRYLDPDHYELGRLGLNRLIAYENTGSSSRLREIEAHVRLADWDLLYSHNRLAIKEYQQAYEMMKLEGIALSSIQQFFSPEIPIVLPTFIPNPLASPETPLSRGYIDVTFEVTRFGESRRIRIADSTTNVTRAETSRIVNLVKRSRFRPRMFDGQFANSSMIGIRYYVND